MINYRHTKQVQLKTSTWAGGTTTQLAIYPETAEYAKFNFDFRISYATVEIPESTFTFMPGVTRHLMILNGCLEIDHIDRYKKQLNKFDLDVFNGEWPTKAKGKVTDFNLMTRGKTVAELDTLILASGLSQPFSLEDRFTYTGFYLFKGEMNIKTVGINLKMAQGDFVLFNHNTEVVLKLLSETPCEVIVSKVVL